MDNIIVSDLNGIQIPSSSSPIIGQEMPVNVSGDVVVERGKDGKDGKDGFSPIASVSQTSDGAIISITDADGTTTANIYNGVDGTDGAAASVSVGTTTTTAAGTNASVVNSGTSSAAILDFSIPRGEVGENGEDGFSPTVQITELSGGSTIIITDKNGEHGTTIYNGADGDAATVSVGSTTTGAAGTNASVVNSGTSSAAVLDFTIPRGADGNDGAPGADGQAATISVGTTTTGNPGTNASVVNSGTSSAAVLNFTIPRGNTGETGATGAGAIADYVNYETILNADQTSGTFSYTATKNGFILLTMAANNSRSFSTIQMRPAGTTTDINIGSFVISAFSSAGNTQSTMCFPMSTGDTVKATNLSTNVFVTSRTMFVPYK